MTYEKSGVGEMNDVRKFPGRRSQKPGNQKNSNKLAPVSVRIFMVFITANFRALCSCLSLAKSIAVTLSRKRIPPTYITTASYPAYPSAPAMGPAKAIMTARNAAPTAVTEARALE